MQSRQVRLRQASLAIAFAAALACYATGLYAASTRYGGPS
jgi:hypothetical protein